MQSAFNTLEPKDKARYARAFFILKDNPDFKQFLDFLDYATARATRDLITLPLDQVEKQQGRVQAVMDLTEMIEQLDRDIVEQLINVATNS